MGLRIAAVLPNPAGDDTIGEWIAIRNEGSEYVSFDGWKIVDAKGKSYTLTGSLSGNEERRLPYTETKITLNNTEEELRLYNDTGKCVQTVTYTGPGEGEVVVVDEGMKLLADEGTKDEVGVTFTEETGNALKGSIEGGVQNASFSAQPLFFGALTAFIFAIVVGMVIQKGELVNKSLDEEKG